MNLRANVPIFLKKLIWELKYGVQNRAPCSIPEDVVAHLSRLPNDARILELGCGRGSLFKGLRQAGGTDIIAVSISRQPRGSSRTSNLLIRI
jgi:hypothetical protein